LSQVIFYFFISRSTFTTTVVRGLDDPEESTLKTAVVDLA